ncbi:MAG: V-type ATP synthase subunit I [Firmicutes bacterium]|nr:V-type ATP synthase subunit I [Bacillota bacterium]MDD7602046.1 V-type ATP synthase subunit I [Bacillota bacterium]MDY5856039.1 V-type ATP synthase subunit I [Anaerovoracaceae bacterium]
MSIVKMQKVAVIGLDTRKKELMSRLMDFGAVELTDQAEKLEDELWKNAVVRDENQEEVSRLEGKISRAEQALEIIEKYDPGRKPLFKTRREVDRTRAEAVLEKQEDAEKKIEAVLHLNERLHQNAEGMNRIDSDRLALGPWSSYDLPLEVRETRQCVMHMGVLPVSHDPGETGRQLEETAGEVVFRLAGSDRDFHYIAFLTTREKEEEAVSLLKQKGFSETSFHGFSGTVKENLERLSRQRAALEAASHGIEAEIAEKACLREEIEEYCDMMTVEADKEKIRTRLLKTRRTFFLEGWIPAGCTEKAAAILEENGCYYAFRDPEEGEDVPVVLNNSSFFTPFESITEMYSLPDYHGFDPTSIFALFYAIFFGMMLSDAGYGIVMAVICFVVLKKYPLEGNMYKMIKLFFYCGISTTFWGAMFGGWFGNIVEVVSSTFAGHTVTLPPIWFNPIEDPMTLLIFSLALGIIHIFIGMGIKAYMQIRDGHWFDAVCDEGFWYLTILGLIGWLGGGTVAAGLVSAGKWMTIIGAAGLLLTGGRHNKGFGKITGGLGNIYNITSYLSDILSYARILALGLATGVIAQVVNTMGGLFGGGIGGAIALIIIFIIGHVFNLAINALGAFIHSSRLQYIEFFGKFYEDGGEPFDPFRRKTRYIKIAQNEQEAH